MLFLVAHAGRVVAHSGALGAAPVLPPVAARWSASRTRRSLVAIALREGSADLMALYDARNSSMVAGRTRHLSIGLENLRRTKARLFRSRSGGLPC